MTNRFRRSAPFTNDLRARLPAVAAAAVMAVLICVPRRASAQSVTIPNAPSSLGWQDGKGAAVVARPSSNYPYGISLSDCAADYSLTFPIALTGFNANNALEVWAGLSGVDCSDDTQRVASTTQTCWKVTPSSLSLVPFQTISIKVRDIIANPATKTSNYVAQNASICGAVDYSSYDVYFLLTVGGTAQTYAKQSIVADTIGPQAVTDVSVTQGDTRLFVSWNPSVDSGSSDATQFSIYYQATTPDLPCAAPGLTSTSHPVSGGTVVASATSTEVEIDGLSDGTSYAVAVAAQDAFLNDSNHPLVCQSPEPRSGAEGASGGCAVTRMGGAHGATWLGVVAFVASTCAMRRKRWARRGAPSALETTEGSGQ